VLDKTRAPWQCRLGIVHRAKALSRHHTRTLQRCSEIREQIRHLPGVLVSEILTPAEIAEAADALDLRWRRCIFSPFVTLWMFVWQALSPGASCREAVLRLLSYRQSRGMAMISCRTGAYCRARGRLSTDLVVALMTRVAEKLHAREPRSARWLGRRVKIVDGTTVSMPDTAANQRRFPQQSSQKPGLGFPIARLLGVFCWSSGALMAHATGPVKGKTNSELGLLRGLLGHFQPGDVVLGDRYFSSYFMIALLSNGGVDIVFRQHQRRKTDFRRGRSLGRCDHVVAWQKPRCPDWLDADFYAQLPDCLMMRELRAGNKVLVTTLLDPQEVSAEALQALYQTRWHCELDLRSIKQMLGMDVLRGQTPDMVEKEIAVHLFAYNLIRALLARAADVHHLAPRRLSFTAALNLLLAQGMLWVTLTLTREMAEEILSALAGQRVGERPGRCEPRAVKRRPKPHPLLTQPRREARRALIIQRAA